MSSVALMAWLVIAYSLIISLYAIAVRQATLRGNSQDAVEQAALSVARQLTAVTVSSSRFGAVGLCDLDRGNNTFVGLKEREVIGLNSLFATLRLDSILAAEADLPYMSRLVGEDLQQAHKLERELIDALNRAILPNYSLPGSQGASSSLYQQVFKTALSGKQSAAERLVDLKISLGNLEGNTFSSLVDTPGLKEEIGLDFVNQGRYRPLMLIPVPLSRPVKFYPLATKAQLVNHVDFVVSDSSVAPSAVLVEATYRSPGKAGREGVLRTRSACALVGAPILPSPASVFMISFPHGVPGQFQSIKDLLRFKQWKAGGEWQQAVGGAVPGKGRLEPPLGIDAGEMNPGEAIQMSLYHWLLFCGQHVKPEQLELLLSRSFAGQSKSSGEPVANSALTKDVGARSFALLYQSGSGGAGQEILASAFDAGRRKRVFPQSAFPLIVDESGKCRLPGRRGFDRKLVMEFMSALHQTNLAAIESYSTAKAVEERLDQAIKQIDQQLALVKEELSSTDQRLTRMNSTGSLTTVAADEKQFRLLLASQLQLNQTLTLANEKRQNYIAVKRRAGMVSDNAEKAALVSFEICADIARFAASGLSRVDGSPDFLLNKTYCFTPQIAPVGEEAIYKGATGAVPFNGQGKSASADGSSSWTDPKFSVWREAPASTMVEGISLAALRQQTAWTRTSEPLFLILQSQQLTEPSAPELGIYFSSPFWGSGIAAGELTYFAQDALRTGSKPEVGWSVLLRDEVACQSETCGQPVASPEPRWCQKQGLEMTACPGLAAEVQIRAPLPAIPDLPVGSYLTNPRTHERVSQIPPMPSDML